MVSAAEGGSAGWRLMGVAIFTEDYRRRVAEAAAGVASPERREPSEPSAEEVRRALVDDADRWSAAARHWLGV